MARIARTALAGMAALWGLSAPNLAGYARAACALEAGERHDVSRVLAGDTLALDDGREVRLIGALAPDTAPASSDAQHALMALIAGRGVQLRYEGRRQDRYGRILAQVFAADRAEGAGDGLWLQAAMVRAGHARAYTLPGNGACLGELLAAEGEARRAGRGLWTREAYRVRAATDVASLLRLTGQFAVVEGRVAAVGRSAKTLYLNFGDDWRRDFTASLALSQGPRSDAAQRAQALAGRTLRVRGWIERRNGPLIALGSLDEVEVLDGVERPSSPPGGEERGAGESPPAVTKAPR